MQWTEWVWTELFVGKREYTSNWDISKYVYNLILSSPPHVLQKSTVYYRIIGVRAVGELIPAIN